MERILRISAFAVALVALAMWFTACGGGSGSEVRSSSAPYSDNGNAFVLNGGTWTTPLIAGGGQGFVGGGGPGGSTQCGTVTFSTANNGGVTITYELTNDYYFCGDAGANMQVYVGAAGDPLPKTMAPGKFAYQGYATPNEPNGSGTLTTGPLGDGKYNFAVHANVCHTEGGTDGSCGRTPGVFNTLGLFAGDKDEQVGTVTLGIDETGQNLVVTTTIDNCGQDGCTELTSVHMYIGTTAPESHQSGNGQGGWQDQMATVDGWGPFMNDHNVGDGDCTDTFTIPLSTFNGQCGGDDCTGADLSTLYFALHASAGDTCPDDDTSSGYSATAWSPCAQCWSEDEFGNQIPEEAGYCDVSPLDGIDDNCGCRHRFLQRYDKDGNPVFHFKSYDSCAFADFPSCEYTPGEPGQEFKDSAYAFDNTLASDRPVPDQTTATGTNEVGWFKNYGYNNWGWFVQGKK